MKKALIITGKYVQDPEFIFPYYRFQEEGYEVVVATEDGKETFGVWGTKVPGDVRIDQLCDDDYEVLILPGGARALEYIRQNKSALDFIRAWDKKGGVIACICHGAQLLISASVVKGRNISGYYSIKDDIINAGGKFVDAPFVTDRNIITSPHYKYMGSWMHEVMRVLHTQNR